MAGWATRYALAAACVASLCAVAAFGLGGGGHRMAPSAVSPDGTYRIDWVTPNRLDRLVHFNMLGPGRVELRNNLTGRLVARSGVLDLDLGGNGQAAWLMADIGMVSVGAGAEFLHIHPLAPDGHALPIEKEFSGETTTSTAP